MTKQIKSKIDKRITTIGDDDVGDDTRYDYTCDWCNCLLVRLSSGNNSPSWFCRQCSIEYPDQSEIRKKTRLGTQREETEPAISSVGEVPDISISHTIPIRGGFAELQKKGLRIKDYRTTEKQ